MKKAAYILLCVLAALVMLPLHARADMGPKPSVVVGFKGLEGERYYATLLSANESTGPFSAPRGGENALYQQGDEDYDIFQKFAEYQDTDGFYFLQYFQNCTDTARFSWTYYPPQEFKVLLYFPGQDRFVASERLERYAFDSYFTADASGLTDGLRVAKAYHYAEEGASLLARTMLTIGVELLIALLFGLREKRVFRFIAAVNIATQVALNAALFLIDYSMGALAFLLAYVLLEFLVFIVEGILYAVFLKKRSEKKISGFRAWAYALTANAASFAAGMALALFIPGLF